ncbi:MAG: PstS family phosphate ABC transporter substrate-binding protein [Planctomycetia bacterium]|nr:PstS family phosphate ABC transporter substrate-binding protein [Planctomycetia bacterium]
MSARFWLVAVTFTCLSACGDGDTGQSVDLKSLTGTIKIDGSSTVYLVTEAVAEEFQKASRVKVTVGISGTGGGMKKFCRGEIDIADASRPILKAEIEAARKNGIQYIELPVCFDALTVAVNPSNPLNSIKVSELKKMWEPDAQGKVSRWNQVNSAWQDAELILYGAGTDSGTFDYFTEAVVGKAKSSRGDYGANEDDNVIVQGISGNKNALGYLPFAYYTSNKGKLKALAVEWEKSGIGPIEPNLENVLAGKYNPLSRPLFIYVNRKAADRPEVKAFVEFYLAHASELATEVKYLPLPAAAYEMGRERFQKLQTGTGFGGEPEIGLPVEEILKREPRS